MLHNTDCFSTLVTNFVWAKVKNSKRIYFGDGSGSFAFYMIISQIEFYKMKQLPKMAGSSSSNLVLFCINF
jgi:hypothetical protein